MQTGCVFCPGYFPAARDGLFLRAFSRRVALNRETNERTHAGAETRARDPPPPTSAARSLPTKQSVGCIAIESSSPRNFVERNVFKTWFWARPFPLLWSIFWQRSKHKIVPCSPYTTNPCPSLRALLTTQVFRIYLFVLAFALVVHFIACGYWGVSR